MLGLDVLSKSVGLSVGETDGEKVGSFVSSMEGDLLGLDVLSEEFVGLRVGDIVGENVGDKVGDELRVGLRVGFSVEEVGRGEAEGLAVGLVEGREVGVCVMIDEKEIEPLLASSKSFPGAPAMSASEFTATLRPNSMSPTERSVKLISSTIPLNSQLFSLSL